MVNFPRNPFKRRGSEGIETPSAVPLLDKVQGSSKRERLIKIVAEVKGIPVEEVTSETPLGDEHAQEIAFNVIWQLGGSLVVSQGDTVGDLLKQIGE